MAGEVKEAEAMEIYQRLLVSIADSYFVRDFAAFSRAVHAPHNFMTDGKILTVKTLAELEKVFEGLCDYIAGMGVTDYVRTCIGATFCGSDRIIGGHMTDILRNGTQLREPYEVWSTLERIEGEWKVISSQNSLPDTTWHAHAFQHGIQGD